MLQYHGETREGLAELWPADSADFALICENLNSKATSKRVESRESYSPEVERRCTTPKVQRPELTHAFLRQVDSLTDLLDGCACTIFLMHLSSGFTASDAGPFFEQSKIRTRLVGCQKLTEAVAVLRLRAPLDSADGTQRAT